MKRSLAVVMLAAALSLAPLAQAAVAKAAPAPAWRLISVTGPTNLPPVSSEVQRVRVKAAGGSFTLAPTTGEGEGTLSYAKGVFGTYAAGATEITFLAVAPGAFEVGQEITAGPGIVAGTTVAAVSTDGKTITLSQPTAAAARLTIVEAASAEVGGLSTSFGAFRAGDTIAAPGIPAGTKVVGVASGALTISAMPTAPGTVPLTTRETTAPIAYDAPASGAGGVQEALEALAAFGPRSVAVVGGPGDPTGERAYSVTLEVAYADGDVPQMVADGSALAGPSPYVKVTTFREGGPGAASLAAYATNVGGATTAGPVRVKVGPLPAGITATAAAGQNGSAWSCAPLGSGLQTVECESSDPTRSGATMNTLTVPLTIGAGAPARSEVTVSVSGGGAAGLFEGLYSYEEPLIVSTTPARPGVEAFWAGAFDADGTSSTQAGGHPSLAGTGFLLNTVRAPSGKVIPAGDLRTVNVELPPGFLGNPLVTPRCPEGALLPGRGEACSGASVVGAANAQTSDFGGGFGGSLGGTPVVNDEPPFGYPAEFGFEVRGAPIFALARLRSDRDYGISIEAPNIVMGEYAFGSFLSLFGAPPSDPGVAFLTNPTDCAGQARRTPVTTIQNNSWQDQDPSAVDNEMTVSIPPVTNCAALAGHFRPSFAMRPESHEAASPSAFTADLTMPQEGLGVPGKLAAPELRKTVVTLPEGVNVNPSSANGLAACTEAQMGLTTTEGAAPNPIRFDKSEPRCPDASKLGTVEAKSPLLEETLDGTIYLAAQEKNPFHSLLALYMVIDSPENGVLVKLPGEVTPDPSTGQLTATFDHNPQLPVEHLTLHFRGGGPRSPLATPAACGSYTTHGVLTPWSAPESGPPAHTTDRFAISSGAGGGACSTSENRMPFAPRFEAGTTAATAGAYAPLVIKLGRKDGEQALKRLDFTLPPGLTGKLAGIAYCPDGAIAAAAGRTGKAEQANPSCPAASRLGTVDTAAGFGSEPIHVGGHVYLAGPYEGAPLSSVVITPALAGPFDLGTVVVRAPLDVDPETAQITARSDEIPHILKGIPLQLRSVEIKVNRQGFTLNPTSCRPMAVTSSLRGLGGATAKPSSRFQVTGCRALRFKPRLKLRVLGKTNRNAKPRLKAVLTARPGEANIRRAQVNLPHSEFLEQNHIKTVCTRVQWAKGNGNGSACPKGSIYGRAKAWTPLLDHPLEGFVYLRSNGGERKLPDLVAGLNGQVNVALWGKVDSGRNKGIRNTFEVVPDAPVSRFVLEMNGGRKGLLVNSENLCNAKKSKRRAIVRLVGHNGKVRQWKPLVHNQCGKHRRARKRRRHHQARH